MKILLLNQFFWPDAAPTGQLLTDLAVGLRERGHEVHALCTDSKYSILETAGNPDVIIRRVKAAPFVRGRLGRALSYLSFLASCTLIGLFEPKADLIITLTTPPLLSLAGTLIKMLRGSRHFIWEMDVYPDVAVDLNYIKDGGFLDRFTGALVDHSRRYADGILALGDCMRQRLVARGIPAKKIHVVDNWADGRAIVPVERPDNFDSLTLLYSGNLGLAHDIDTIAEAMENLKGDPRFRFVFAGGGPLREMFETSCGDKNITDAEFRGYTCRSELSESFGSCDVGLITQRKSCLGSVVPSKIYGLMAAGRPILFIGPAGSTVAEIIARHQCGWHIENGDVSELLEILRFLAREPALRRLAGQRARAALEKYYDLPIGVQRICSLILDAESQLQPIKQFEIKTRQGASAVGD